MESSSVIREYVPVIAAAVLPLVAIVGGAKAQTTMTSSSNAAPVVLPEINVVGTTPLPGAGVERDKIPMTTYVLDPDDISFSGIPALTDAITREIPSTRISDVEGNPFQPDIIYRGFIASPVAGTPQGLAVYVNGACFNDPFGDTVNWDLIPAVAIQGVTVESSNPLFGLNALGGSVNVQLKNGFTFQGGDFSTYAGSYGRLGSSMEYGKQVGDFAIYGSGEYIHDSGFQPTGESQIERGFMDLGWRGPGSEVHLDITAANNWLGKSGRVAGAGAAGQSRQHFHGAQHRLRSILRAQPARNPRHRFENERAGRGVLSELGSEDSERNHG
jgi:hypothetical protein